MEFLTVLNTFEDGVQVFVFDSEQNAIDFGRACEQNGDEFIGVCTRAVYDALMSSIL